MRKENRKKVQNLKSKEENEKDTNSDRDFDWDWIFDKEWLRTKK